MAKKLAPIHPGEVLREEFLIPLGRSVGALAEACGVPHTRIERIANEETAITADTALRLGKALCTSPFALAEPAERIRHADRRNSNRKRARKDQPDDGPYDLTDPCRVVAVGQGARRRYPRRQPCRGFRRRRLAQAAIMIQHKGDVPEISLPVSSQQMTMFLMEMLPPSTLPRAERQRVPGCSRLRACGMLWKTVVACLWSIAWCL